MESLKDREPYLLDCPRCTACRWTPNATGDERFAGICPSYHYGKFHSYSAGGKLITAYAKVHDLIAVDDALVDTVYACTNCGGCDVSCKANLGDLIEPMTSIYALRAHIVEEGKLPVSLQQLLDNLRRTGNRAGLPAAARGEWCADLAIKQWPQATGSVLLQVGDLAFDRASWPLLRDVAQKLVASGADVVLGGVDESDVGALAFDIGDMNLAGELARAFAQKVSSRGVKTIICCDDSAFAGLRNFLPRLEVTLGGIRVEHVSQWLAANLPSATATSAPRQRVTYHDACRLGRVSDPYKPWDGKRDYYAAHVPYRTSGVTTSYGDRGVYEEPRRLLAAANLEVVEMPRNRESAFCCGNGAGAREFNPEFAESAGLERLREAVSTGIGVLVTSCASCAGHLQEVARKHGLPISVKNLLMVLKEREEMR